MASETKAGTTRRKSSTETKVAAPKAVKKSSSKTVSTTAAPTKAKTVTKTTAKGTTVKAAPAKTAKPAEKKPAAPRKSKSVGQPITASARLQHIEMAAYYIAEKSGFSRDPADCWAAAENEIDGLLLAGKL